VHMTQAQLVRSIAESCQLSNKAAKQILDTLAATAIKEVKKSGAFVVPGLGKLVRVERKARIGRNPATGETINIPAKKVVKYRVTKAVKDAIMASGKGKKVTASLRPLTRSNGGSSVLSGGVAMFRWLAGLWHRIDGWMHRRARQSSRLYYRSNLHGRHR